MGLHLVSGCRGKTLPPPAVTPPPPQAVKLSTQAVITKVTLLPREEKLPAIGVSPASNRDIGFATVFLSLENHHEQKQTITIQKIEIQSGSGRQVQPFAFEARQIELKPLENSVIDVHLTNKTGYLGGEAVKAVVTYQVGNQVQMMGSEVVDVDRR
ncbi:MAG: hypothetical protein ACOYMP_13095 [Nodosilinea sp.]